MEKMRPKKTMMAEAINKAVPRRPDEPMQHLVTCSPGVSCVTDDDVALACCGNDFPMCDDEPQPLMVLDDSTNAEAPR